MQVTKLSEYQVSIKQDEKPAQVVTNIYDRTFIKNQIEAITTQKDRDNLQRDAELKVCNDILFEMDKLNIKEMPTEVITE